MNWRVIYPVSVSDEELRMAFLSAEGVTDLIARIVDSVYTAANYDEYLLFKYMLIKAATGGNLKPVTVNNSDPKNWAKAFRGISNMLPFMKKDYNAANVMNTTPKNRQVIFMDAQFNADFDVDVLSAAFNMDKADFMGHRILIDSFGTLDTARLAQLFKDDDAYTPLTSAEVAALDAIPAVMVDEDWFVILDNLYEFTENFNGQGMFWNYFYHVWKTFSISPFSNSVVYVPGAPSITSVTVSPDEATVTAGSTLLLSATVVTANFASKAVKWSVVDSTSEEPVDGVSITELGLLTIGPDVDDCELTVTATSAVDSTKKDTATITVGEGA